jgi:hypothetical protein
LVADEVEQRSLTLIIEILFGITVLGFVSSLKAASEVAAALPERGDG